MVTATRIAPEIIACIREARTPTVMELHRVADVIEREMTGHLPFFKWSDPEVGRRQRVHALAFALGPLCGISQDLTDGAPSRAQSQIVS